MQTYLCLFVRFVSTCAVCTYLCGLFAPVGLRLSTCLRLPTPTYLCGLFAPKAWVPSTYLPAPTCAAYQCLRLNYFARAPGGGTQQAPCGAAHQHQPPSIRPCRPRGLQVPFGLLQGAPRPTNTPRIGSLSLHAGARDHNYRGTPKADLWTRNV